MALKFVVDAAGYGALSDSIRALYKPGADGSYQLDVDGAEPAESVTGLKANRDEILGKLTTEKQAREALERQLAEKTGDHSQLLASEQAKTAALTKQLNGLLVQGKAETIARELAKHNAPLLQPWIEKRLTAALGENGEYSTRVLDKNGQPTELTLAALQTEIASDAMFAPLIVGNHSTGTGGSGSQFSTPQPGAGGGQMTSRQIALDAINQMTFTE